ncbi:MAG: hypothetical protein GWP61_04385 [Chloroflexi bacterium]|jgi:hypothetical protein|nr:hypothetical protein [Chloroflexota bacterium]
MKNRGYLFLLLLMFFISACSGRSGSDGSTPESSDGATVTHENRDRFEYSQRLRAMWLGSAIANWTGLITEGVRTEPPFFTDKDWGTVMQTDLEWKEDALIDFVFQDPWLADDDTDIEYVYLHLMDQHGTSELSPEQIAEGWQEHINDYIWVSNQTARGLMRLNALPPVTSMLAVNDNSLAIDAQLTTEIFGALAPGMPDQALKSADLPIRTTASGYSAHAAQFYVVLYSLASQVDPALEPKEQILWMVREARGYIPDSSKTADIVDFVLADYESNPDVDDWERTRDRVYERYHLLAEENGFVYRHFIESSVNFAAGLMALLYGEGDFQRTVQIGSLSGWDSDNGTSTMGGLLGLMLGYETLVAQFPEQELSDRYHILRTRDDLPDYLPTDLQAEDTYELMAARMMPLVEANIIAAGGQVEQDSWALPSPIPPSVEQNPYQAITQQSNNNQMRLAESAITASVNGNSEGAEILVDGLEFDYSGREIFDIPSGLRIKPKGEPIEIEVIYDDPVTLQAIRLVEGGGSGFSSVQAELLLDLEWVPAQFDSTLSSIPDPKVPYEILDFVLMEAETATGFKIIGQPRESGPELVLLELDSLNEKPLP